MYEYFAFLLKELFQEGPRVVMLHTYAARSSNQVQQIAQVWQIKLVFIPPGCTDKLQPLDRPVFGVAKASAQQ
jgi:transposase